MARELHIELLEKLRKSGLGTMEDVSPFMRSYFEKNKKNDLIKYKMTFVATFLRDLIRRNFIKSEQEDNYFDVLISLGFPANRQVDDIDIKVCITSDGLDYLDNNDNNERAKKLYRLTIINIIIAIVLAVFMAWVGWSNLQVAKSSVTVKNHGQMVLKPH